MRRWNSTLPINQANSQCQMAFCRPRGPEERRRGRRLSSWGTAAERVVHRKPGKIELMPKDYSLEITPANAQRREEYTQDDAWITEFLQRTPVGHVATRWDEQPFITPTTFWYDPGRHEIYFHSNIIGRVRANSE